MIHPKVKHIAVLFIDIETAPTAKKFFDLPANLAVAWNDLCEKRYAEEMKKDEKLTAPALFVRDAALYPEFGKIVCISVGVFNPSSPNDFAVWALYGDDENDLLKRFSTLVIKRSAVQKIICGHNLKQFDLPYIIRRAVVNGINLPDNFNIFGLKPWDLDGSFIDTRDMWASIAFNLGSCSLESICAVLNIPSPKEEMNGSMVGTVYYNHNDPDRLKKIGKYCNNDVIATARIFQRFSDYSPVFNLVSNDY